MSLNERAEGLMDLTAYAAFDEPRVFIDGDSWTISELTPDEARRLARDLENAARAAELMAEG